VVLVDKRTKSVVKSTPLTNSTGVLLNTSICISYRSSDPLSLQPSWCSVSEFTLSAAKAGEQGSDPALQWELRDTASGQKKRADRGRCWC